MKTRSPQMIGVELPAEGSLTFQPTFSVPLHLIGRFFSSDTPIPLGPHNWQLACGAWPSRPLVRARRPRSAMCLLLERASIAIMPLTGCSPESS